ncbi:unnamed protein product [Tuber aestivum]|uniref:Uncharacterized protein n=1 Tax=Tuber aestivum TaxID=59557 RepID=A0A292Q227_9PEZI|nr:unnamed protein product [Tuber aestivum]
MSAAAKLRIDSATAIRADAAGEMRARVGFSPIAIASPVTDSSDSEVAVTATSATGTCQGPTIWSRVTNPVTVLSPIVMRKLLEPTLGSLQAIIELSVAQHPGCNVLVHLRRLSKQR